MLTSVQITSHIQAQGPLVAFDRATGRATVSLGGGRTVSGTCLTPAAKSATPLDIHPRRRAASHLSVAV